MKKVKLGDLEVSAVGLGCMGFTHAYGTAMDENEAIQALRTAVSDGYTLFDTPECYTGTKADGTTAYNEEVVGKALEPYRNDVIIATKFGVTFGTDGQGEPVMFVDSSRQKVR
jgi:aryl-alcohol dehydrogenase-like predicted oxidoreductase